MLLACAGLIAGAATAAAASAAAAQVTDSTSEFLARQSFPDASGVITTLSVTGPVDNHGAFFQTLGTNGRTCSTCHVASQAMSISAAGIQLRFRESRGRDPLFAAVDGAILKWSATARVTECPRFWACL